MFSSSAECGGVATLTDLKNRVLKSSNGLSDICVIGGDYFESFFKKNADPKVYKYFKNTLKNMKKVEKIVGSSAVNNGRFRETFQKYTGDAFYLSLFVDTSIDRVFLCFRGDDVTNNKDVLVTDRGENIYSPLMTCDSKMEEYFDGKISLDRALNELKR